MKNWKVNSWRKHPVKHVPSYDDEKELNMVLNKLKSSPPLVFAGETRHLKDQLAEVVDGKAFLLQGGDCAESFAEFHPDNIRDTFKVILQMSLVLTASASMPVVKVGRIAGQFSKPRSAPTEKQGDKELPSYLGDNINAIDFNEKARRPDPKRMFKAYSQSASTLNLLRAFSKGGFADLNKVHLWNLDYIKKSPQAKKFKELEDKIIKSNTTKNSILVIVESLYSMEGSIAPLREITEICKKNSVQLLVDEAHAIGILGPEGRGLSFNCRSDITMITGTFGKAFGSGGAFIASNSEIGEYLIQTSGAFRYTTALAPSLAAGALEGLKKILENKEWGNDLLSSASVWKDEIIKNFNFPVQGDSHILSIIVGQEEKAIYLQKYLEENGFLAIAIRPPTVPVGQSRIRITIRRNLDFNLLKNFITVLKEFI